jgi:hypothetical protein
MIILKINSDTHPTPRFNTTKAQQNPQLLVNAAQRQSPQSCGLCQAEFSQSFFRSFKSFPVSFLFFSGFNELLTPNK